MWPTDRWITVLEWFLERHSDTVVLDVGLCDLGLDRLSCGDRVIPCAGLPLSVAIGLLQWGNLFIGVDSCFLHAADLFRVPGVGLFGPTNSREFGFRFGPHRHVSGNPSMHSITVDAVIHAVQSLEDELAVDDA
jgi:ADP-heptose:LPS heptosyltransferase